DRTQCPPVKGLQYLENAIGRSKENDGSAQKERETRGVPARKAKQQSRRDGNTGTADSRNQRDGLSHSHHQPLLQVHLAKALFALAPAIRPPQQKSEQSQCRDN